MHRLRYFVSANSDHITDEELNEVDSKITFDEYQNMEYSGSFIFTKSVIDRDDAVYNMCCGIITEDIILSNGETIYFAFDYGH